MPRGLAIGLLPIGFAIAVIDAWMSIQSIVGMLKPQSLVELIVGGLVGCALTVIAVSAPVLKMDQWNAFLRFCWTLVLLVDIGTSIIGAIWYGVMRKKPNVPVDFSQMHYDPGNVQRTAVFLAFVLLLAGGCVLFGKVLHRLSQRDP